MELEIVRGNEIMFTEGENMSVQCSSDEVFKRYGKEWRIQEKGNGRGNWLLTKSSDIFVNGISYRNFVLEYYNRSRLTKKLFFTFCNDLENGKLDGIIQFDEDIEDCNLKEHETNGITIEINDNDNLEPLFVKN